MLFLCEPAVKIKTDSPHYFLTPATNYSGELSTLRSPMISVELFVIHTAVLLGIVLFIACDSLYFKDLEDFYQNRIVYRTRISRQQFHIYELFLEQKFSFFAPLTSAGRARFISRMLRLAREKEFIGLKGFQVTDTARLMISASAVQLTFGLRHYRLHHLSTIRIFPDTFYHARLQSWMKGAMFESGNLMISWKDFIEGYETGTDNYNLGLHEMAHALEIDVRHTYHNEVKFSGYFSRWLQVSSPTYRALRSGENDFLRQYGGTNVHEFFAVCVEHFFESPEKFSQELPDVFNHLCLVLNQNPLNPTNDYKLTKEHIEAINADPERLPLEKVGSYAEQMGMNRLHVRTAFFLAAGGILFLIGKDDYRSMSVWAYAYIVVAAASGGRLVWKWNRKSKFLSDFGYLLYFLSLLWFVFGFYICFLQPLLRY